MDDIYLFGILAGLIAVQIACLFVKKVWIRLLPLLTVVALMVLCIVMYGLSGWTNWGYLILLALLFGVLAADGVVWLIYAAVRGITKCAKRHGV